MYRRTTSYTPTDILLPYTWLVRSRRFDSCLNQWIAAQSAEGVMRRDLIRESEIRQQSRAILEAFTGAIGRAEITARIDLDADEWADLKQLLKEIGRAHV